MKPQLTITCHSLHLNGKRSYTKAQNAHSRFENTEIQISNLEREFLMHHFFFRRGFCAGAMVFKFVYFKIFNNETDMHSLFVNNLFELRAEQRKTCYYGIRSVSALLFLYITDSICLHYFSSIQFELSCTYMYHLFTYMSTSISQSFI